MSLGEEIVKSSVAASNIMQRERSGACYNFAQLFKAYELALFAIPIDATRCLPMLRKLVAIVVSNVPQ